MTKTIRGRDGYLREEPDSYRLMDGEAIVVRARFMDQMQRSVRGASVTDHDDLRDAEQRRQAAYDKSVADAENAWKDEPAPAPRKPAAEMTVNELNDARDAAYAKSVADMNEAWRGEAA